MIQTLEQEGFLLRIPGDDRVLLGPELLRLARNTDEQLLLREVSRPIISDLVAAVRETVTLSVVSPDGGLDLVHQVDAPAQLRPQSWVGQRFPLHASASGKVLLATYDEERLDRFLDEPLARFTPSTITIRRGVARGARARARAAVRPRQGRGGGRPVRHRHGDPRTGGRAARRAHLGGPTQRLDRTGGDTRSTTCSARPARSAQRSGEGGVRRRFSRSSAGMAADAPGGLQFDGDEQRAVLGRAGNGPPKLEDAAQPLVEALPLQV